MRDYINAVNDDSRPHPEDQYPDPPTNDDFNDLPEAFQDKVAARFEAGTKQTLAEHDYWAYRAESAKQNAIDRQHERERREREAREQRIARAQVREARRRANKASIGERQEWKSRLDSRRRPGH